ncbi:hypothetical protein SPRG_07525 [Saprolegnia parasitica CBS 223.65]|uniref:Uncharacterized protein n=1 Tax=Saprolegnia parasitica (strain CBS 223.65) TaxID=695850 RepID=A0A067CKG5_SAPPC|nr:hypothetical protein SPRG_07525 [Saprolegnia parasitica CBS 223.65]KDO27277.1 hypothetical protein SPRG_07525 [Saprolegnia parasitica CBS 223.65]|eukprot:XP_012202052.1 hypothetical protein SPRG_07525 [Saprolegnia parasitica CBS 223.65]
MRAWSTTDTTTTHHLVHGRGPMMDRRSRMTIVYACKDDGRSCVLDDRVATQAQGTPYFEVLLHLPTLREEATSYYVRVVRRHGICELEMRPPIRSAIWSCSFEPASLATFPVVPYSTLHDAPPFMEPSLVAPSTAIALMLLVVLLLLEATRRRLSDKGGPARRLPPPLRWETRDGREHAASTFSGTATDVTYLVQKRL